MRYYIDEVLWVNGEILDRGFILDTEFGCVEWTDPADGIRTDIYSIEECTYAARGRCPVSIEDGELIGEPEEDYYAKFS